MEDGIRQILRKSRNLADNVSDLKAQAGRRLLLASPPARLPAPSARRRPFLIPRPAPPAACRWPPTTWASRC
eukprot:scaffold1378_cov24-Tisochrysis_lutea.AAC.1